MQEFQTRIFVCVLKVTNPRSLITWVLMVSLITLGIFMFVFAEVVSLPG